MVEARDRSEKGPRRNRFALSRPAWESDSIDAIEREPEHTRQYSRILAIEQRSKMAPGWDAKVWSYFCAGPNPGDLVAKARSPHPLILDGIPRHESPDPARVPSWAAFHVTGESTDA